MSSTSDAAVPPSAGEGGTAPVSEDAGPIDAVPVRHPGRWVALVVIAIVFAMIISSFVTNPRWDWPFAFQVMNYSPVLEGLVKGTILATIGSMLIGVTLGVVIGVMRLSDNPVLKFVGFLYTWFFRGIPRLVLVVLFGTGIGSGYAAMPALIARSVAVDQLGSAVSFNQVLRTAGGAVGAALSAAVLAAHPSGSTYSTDECITMAFGVGVVCCAVVMAALVAHAVLSRRRTG